MKANKMITIDTELFEKINKTQLNVSEFCNEKLWTYMTEIEHIKNDPEENKQELENRMSELIREKEKMEHHVKIKESMEKAGITDEKIFFLKNMPTNILVAKDMKLAWKRKFKEDIDWNELKKLKTDWI